MYRSWVNVVLLSQLGLILIEEVSQAVPVIIAVSGREVLFYSGHKVLRCKFYIIRRSVIDFLAEFVNIYLFHIHLTGGSIIITAAIRCIEITQAECNEDKTLNSLKDFHSAACRNISSADNRSNQRSEMPDTDTIEPINTLLLLCGKICAFKRKVGIVPVLCHIFQAVDVLLDLLRLELRYLYGFRFFCIHTLNIVGLCNIVTDSGFCLSLHKNWSLFKEPL